MNATRTAWLELATAAWLLAAAGCAARTAGPETPSLPPEYAALPDTLVCVVDRSAPDGLRTISGKVRGDEVVLLVDGRITPLGTVHPIEWIAGYAGAEEWVRRGEQVTLSGDRFSRTGGERQINADLLARVGEFRGVLLFAGRDDTLRPNALYVPTAPGCIFQAYVREDLIRR